MYVRPYKGRVSAFVTLLGATLGGPAGVLGGLGIFVVGVLVAFLFATDSAIGGAIGGFLAD
ncbi:hypothetical protein KY092_12005 [Natronomonas gomsonensis]|uniref:hypothetical protein n=1 Tax=Natronomonas gomsonensis TaxID=1046043 RepID=UPI0020CA4005|nr:hypothetical protein [Natronomonas gomsonensis]MCY4731277.1 hypothetical protein [Natronomonas gomsonensis]